MNRDRDNLQRVQRPAMVYREFLASERALVEEEEAWPMLKRTTHVRHLFVFIFAIVAVFGPIPVFESSYDYLAYLFVCSSSSLCWLTLHWMMKER